MEARVVVMARFDYPARETKHFQVKRGDLGILGWRSHRRHPNFLKPIVVWDKDHQQKARETIWASLEVVGLQTVDTRIMLTQTPVSKAR